MSNLKLCPLCCGEADSRLVLVAYEGAQWWVTCKQCYFGVHYGGAEKAQAAAEEAWERRDGKNDTVFNIVGEVETERRRQILKEGYKASHDASHSPGSLARAGAAYALMGNLLDPRFTLDEHPDGAYGKLIQIKASELAKQLWPWDEDDSFKPKDARRNLVRAAALIVAEIERMDRAIEVAANTGDEA